MKNVTCVFTSRTNRKNQLIILSVIILVCSEPAGFALDPMGPPVASMEPGQYQVGFDFSYSNMDLQLHNGVWTETLDSVFLGWGDAVDLKLKDFEVNRGYAGLGYGISENFEAFFRLGITKAEFGDSLWEDYENFDSESEPAVGFGLKATFLDEGNFQIGGLIQFNWADYDGELSAPHWGSSDFVEVDTAETQIALGMNCMLSDRFSVYGGPFLHFVDGELYDTFSEVDPDTGGLLTSEYLWDIEQDSVFGGYLGARMELGQNCFLNVEFQHTAAADAFGASIAWKF
jgi:hypothetical protein